MVVIALMRLCCETGLLLLRKCIVLLLLSLSHRLKEQDDASDVKDVLPRLCEEAKDDLHALNTR